MILLDSACRDQHARLISMRERTYGVVDPLLTTSSLKHSAASGTPANTSRTQIFRFSETSLSRFVSQVAASLPYTLMDKGFV